MKSRKKKKQGKSPFIFLFISFVFLLLAASGVIRDLSKKPSLVKGISDVLLTPTIVIPTTVISSSPAEDVSPTPYSNYRLPILMYHYVEYVTDKRDTIRQKMAVNPADFEHQIKSFKDAGYTFHFMHEIPDIISGRTPYDPKAVFLTFDDGYEDFYMVAYPILKKYGAKSTAYIVYDFIDRYNYMKEDQIKTLVKEGLVEIASHTLDHMDLKGASTESATLEIVQSKEKLSEKFGIPITSFAYPFGSFSAYSVDRVKEAGYASAVSVISGTEQSEGNLFYLSRIRPGILDGRDIVKSLEEYKK